MRRQVARAEASRVSRSLLVDGGDDGPGELWQEAHEDTSINEEAL